MTVLIGVRCVDGVVIGADSMATSAMGLSPLVHLPSNSKIKIHTQNIISASTGAVGFGQRLIHHIDAAIDGGVFRNFNKVDSVINVSKRFIKGLQESLAPVTAGQGIGFGALLAAVIKDEPYLYEYDTVGFQPEIKEGNLFYVSIGSGQLLADPFLAFVNRVLWKNTMPTVDQAKFGIYWALDHTIRLAPIGVGGPIRLATLSKVQGNWTAAEIEDTQEASEYVTELEAHIMIFANRPLVANASGPPPVPAPSPV